MSVLRIKAVLGLLFFILSLSGAIAFAQENATQTARVTTSTASVNLRTGPGQDFGVIRGVANGTEVIVLDSTTNPEWFRVRLDDDTEGYISAALLVIDLTQPTAPPLVSTAVTKGTSSVFYVVQGDLLVAGGQYPEAVEAYTLALDLDPSNADLYLSRGRAYTWATEYELALADFDRVLDLDSRSAAAYYESGNAYSWLGEYEQAIENYDRAIQLDRLAAYFYADRGNAYTWLDDYEQALEDYNRAHLLDPNNSVYYDFRGNAYAGLEDHTSAIADYNQAITLNPGNALAYFDRGVSYYNTKRYGKALIDFNHAIELSSSNGNFYGWRGFAYMATAGTDAEIRADMCQHVQLAGDAAYPEVIDVIEEQGWRC